MFQINSMLPTNNNHQHKEIIQWAHSGKIATRSKVGKNGIPIFYTLSEVYNTTKIRDIV
eukprot:c40492_g1_i1 orf=194-370(+)